MPNVDVSLDFPFAIVPSIFSNIYVSCVFCVQCCCISGLSIRDCHSSVFSNVYLSCVLQCPLDCPFAIILLRFSLTFICPVFFSTQCCCISGLFIRDYPSLVFSNFYLSCVFCAQCCCISDCPFAIVPSVFSNVHSSYVVWDQCSCISGLSISDYPFGFL